MELLVALPIVAYVLIKVAGHGAVSMAQRRLRNLPGSSPPFPGERWSLPGGVPVEIEQVEPAWVRYHLPDGGGIARVPLGEFTLWCKRLEARG